MKTKMPFTFKTHISPHLQRCLHFCCATAPPSSSLVLWFHFCGHFHSINLQKQCIWGLFEVHMMHFWICKVFGEIFRGLRFGGDVQNELWNKVFRNSFFLRNELRNMAFCNSFSMKISFFFIFLKFVVWFFCCSQIHC